MIKSTGFEFQKTELPQDFLLYRNSSQITTLAQYVHYLHGCRDGRRISTLLGPQGLGPFSIPDSLRSRFYQSSRTKFLKGLENWKISYFKNSHPCHTQYSSDSKRRPQKLKKSPTCFDITVVFTLQRRNKLEIFSKFCGLLRKAELQQFYFLGYFSLFLNHT